MNEVLTLTLHSDRGDDAVAVYELSNGGSTATVGFGVPLYVSRLNAKADAEALAKKVRVSPRPARKVRRRGVVGEPVDLEPQLFYKWSTRRLQWPGPQPVSCVRLTIVEVDPGTHYHDTCISEIGLR